MLEEILQVDCLIVSEDEAIDASFIDFKLIEYLCRFEKPSRTTFSRKVKLKLEFHIGNAGCSDFNLVNTIELELLVPPTKSSLGFLDKWVIMHNAKMNTYDNGRDAIDDGKLPTYINLQIHFHVEEIECQK